MTTARTDDPGRATDICDDDDIQVSATAAVPYPPVDPGGIERVLSAADLAVISTGHADACACWPCLDRFGGEVCAWWADLVARRAVT